MQWMAQKTCSITHTAVSIEKLLNKNLPQGNKNVRKYLQSNLHFRSPSNHMGIVLNCCRCPGLPFGWSHTEPCRTCTMCQRPMHMRVPCTEADDTICECEDGFFSAPRNGGCIPCNECKPGMGVGMVCTPDSNTLCETCPIGFFSDVISNREPCLPCTLCLGDQDILQDCTPTSDSICISKSLTHHTAPRVIMQSKTLRAVITPYIMTTE
uniref:TNFR-Cys domain-containing protein n=1 Tax=Eptatretus burgeri TaxID=7764 RepID=A0A8C4ND06_EPTBU